MQQTIMIGGGAAWVIAKPEGMRKRLRLGSYACPVELRNGAIVHSETGLPVPRSAFVPTDLTGSDAAMEIRSAPGGTLYLRLTVGNGLTLGAVPGAIDIVVSPADAAAISWSKAVFGLVVRGADGINRRVLQGDLSVDAGIVQVLP